VKELVREALGKNKTVAVWGLAFKANTDDARDSPSIPLIRALLADKRRVLVHDPAATKNFCSLVPGTEPSDKEAMLAEADILVIMTEWDDYRTLSEEELAMLKGKTVVDCRNILARTVELDKLHAAGVRYVGLGVHEHR
jgi:UDPglucose 6-dehydrogenase